MGRSEPSRPGRLLLRADGGSGVGMGHVMRCLALAQAWEDAGGEAILAVSVLDRALRARLEREGPDLLEIDADPGSPADARAVIDHASKVEPEWVVVDGYRFGVEYHKRVQDAVARLLCIDDQGTLDRYGADLVLNQNLHARETLYTRREADTALLLGTRYALLRREFRRIEDRSREIPERARNVLVTVGGEDRAGLVPKVLAALEGQGLHATVLSVGPGGAVPTAAPDHGRVAFRSASTDLPRLMAASDLAVSAAGSTVWELAFMGVPALLVATATNQQAVARSLAQRGAAIELCAPASLTVDRLAREIEALAAGEELRRRLSSIGQRLVDGRGAARVVGRLRGRALRLRPVEAGDRRLIWQWANDPVVREASFSSEPIAWEDHLNWFEGRLRSPRCLHYLALDELDEPVGQIRFDLADDSREAEVAVSIAPGSRGSGVGSAVLDLARRRIFGDTEIARVNAYVKRDNLASKRLFEAAGFGALTPTEVRGCPAIHLVLERSS